MGSAEHLLGRAESFFGTYMPSSKLSKTELAQAIYYANLLDPYNNDYIGPGCWSE